MNFVKQKHKHCFAACIVSSLGGKNSEEEQENIVNRFPNELQKGLPDEGVPHTNVEVDIVVRGLGLAEEVIWYVEAIDIQPVLEATKGTKNDKYLLMTFPSRHFVRVKKVFPNGVEVMNPEVGFELWTWETIAKRQCWLGVFLSEQDAIRMGRKQPLIQKAP